MKKSSTLLLIALLSSAYLASISFSDAIAPALNVYDLWKYSTGGPILDLKYISDVDGDTKPDVIVGSGDNNIYLLNGYNGSKIWSRITEGDVASVDLIADITGDGVDDVIAGSDQPLVTLLPGYVYAFDGNNGSDLWTSPTPPVYKVQAVPDVTGDGIPDVAVGWHSYDTRWQVIHSGVYMLDGTNGTAVWSDWRSEGSRTTLYADVTAISDVTGDGKWDVIFAFQEDNLLLINGTDGKELKRVKKAWARVGQNKVYAVPDVSGDGWSDVINLRIISVNGSGFVYAISGPTLETIWRKRFNGSSTENLGWFATYMPDITSDGRPEIVVTMLDSVYCLSGATGNIIWNQTLVDSGLSISSIPDISGDGVYDVIVGARDNKVYLLSGKDGSHIGNYRTIAPPADGAVRAVSYIPDVSGDSLPEVLAGSNSHFVYCLTTPSTPSKVSFSLSPNPAAVGASITLLGNLTTEDNFPISSETLTIRSNGRAVGTITTNSTGWFKASGEVGSAGTFNITVEYAGSVLYNASSDWEVLVVNKAYTSVYAAFIPNPVNSGENCTLIGILVDQFSNPITNATVTLEYSTDYGSTWNPVGVALPTDPYGIFSMTFNAPSPKTYLIRISYAGSPNYESSTTDIPLIVL